MDAPGKFYTVDHVLLTPKREDAGWTVNYDSDDLYLSSDNSFTRFSRGDLVFSASDWSWEITYKRSDKFQKVADIVGNSLAERVMTALGER